MLGVANGIHDMQTVTACVSYKTVLDNAQALNSDYDEIKDELYFTEKSSEKLFLENKSLELIKSSNNYFTLTPQEEHDITSKVHEVRL